MSTGLRPGAGPVEGRWGVGLGEIAASLPKLPGLLRDAVRQLNQFGSVVISDGGIEYDGDEAAWTAVTEVRTHRLVGYLLTGAVRKQADRLPLWWFPGRGLVLDGLTQAGLTAIAVAADGRLSGGVFDIRIPAEVHYRGRFRRKDMTPGVPAALVLADPAVRAAVAATAEAHGVPVRPAEHDALDVAQRRAAGIRSFVGRLTSVI